MAIINNGAEVRFLNRPSKATVYTAATTSRITVPAINAPSAPTAFPIRLVFNDSARESGLTPPEYDVADFSDDVDGDEEH